MELVEKVGEIVLSPEEVPAGGPEDVLSSYQEFLRKSYVELPHPGMLANQWPIMNVPAYVQLSLSKQQRSQHMYTSMEQWPTGSSLFHNIFMNYPLQVEGRRGEVERHQREGDSQH